MTDELGEVDVNALLSKILNVGDAFSDSDGLVSFVNLSSSHIQDTPEFKVGLKICDKIANFVASIRAKTFDAMIKGRIKPLPGDQIPKTQWDDAVSHFIFHMLTEAGGLTSFRIVDETYTNTEYIADFSTAFIKDIFDTTTTPKVVVDDITHFLEGVGDTLRTKWDDRTRSYKTTLVGQCHEAVRLDEENIDWRYVPKIRYYRIVVTADQTEFTTPCVVVKTITFNFSYEYYVSALASDCLDPTTDLYKSFNAFLDKAQEENHKDADNDIDDILNDGVSYLDDRLDINPYDYPRINRVAPKSEEGVNEEPDETTYGTEGGDAVA